MKKRYIVGVVVFLLLCIFVVAGFFMTKDSLSEKTAKLKTDVEALVRTLNAGQTFTADSALPTPAEYPDEFYKAYQLGFEAAPFMLDYVINYKEDGFVGAFLVSAAANNLHLTGIPGSLARDDENSVYSDDPDAYTPVWYAKQLKQFAVSAPEKINAVCGGDAEMTEKTKELEQYGMLAIPTLQKKIDSGELQWIQCASLLSLSVLEERERFDVLSAGYALVGDDRYEQIHRKRLEAIKNKGFDVKWFDEYAKELKLMSRLFD